MDTFPCGGGVGVVEFFFLDVICLFSHTFPLINEEERNQKIVYNSNIFLTVFPTTEEK